MEPNSRQAQREASLGPSGAYPAVVTRASSTTLSWVPGAALNTIHLKRPSTPHNTGTITPIFQMGKFRCKTIWLFAQRHTASWWRSQETNLHVSVLTSCYLIAHRAATQGRKSGHQPVPSTTRGSHSARWRGSPQKGLLSCATLKPTSHIIRWGGSLCVQSGPLWGSL